MKLKKWKVLRVAENKFLNRNVASIVKTYVTPKYMIKYLIQNDFVLNLWIHQQTNDAWSMWEIYGQTF